MESLFSNASRTVGTPYQNVRARNGSPRKQFLLGEICVQLLAVALSDGRDGSEPYAPLERVFACVGWWSSSIILDWTRTGEVSVFVGRWVGAWVQRPDIYLEKSAAADLHTTYYVLVHVLLLAVL